MYVYTHIYVYMHMHMHISIHYSNHSLRMYRKQQTQRWWQLHTIPQKETHELVPLCVPIEHTFAAKFAMFFSFRQGVSSFSPPFPPSRPLCSRAPSPRHFLSPCFPPLFSPSLPPTLTIFLSVSLPLFPSLSFSVSDTLVLSLHLAHLTRYILLHLECHLISSSNLNPIGLLSTEHGKRDLEK